jgi:hypothetical protein
MIFGYIQLCEIHFLLDAFQVGRLFVRQGTELHMNKPIMSISNLRAVLPPIILGLAVFYLVAGLSIINPQNIAWLQHGDPATHYLGWVFFRNSEWAMPLGLNPAYGLEISNAIIYSDSLPGIAIIFKLLSNVLPETFQYFGIWLALCFVLQGFFGWRIAGLIYDNFLFRIICTCFFIFSPPMIWRLNQNIGHLSLVGHFLILAALALAFQPHQRKVGWCWAVLIGVTAAIHMYFLAMVAAIWLGNLFDRASSRTVTTRRLAQEVFSVSLIVGAVLWQIGTFTVLRGADSDGYGVYKFNLVSLIDPGKPGYEYWSYILPDLSGDEGHHEGFNFLGLGILLLIPPALFGLKKNFSLLQARCIRTRWTVLALILLTAFAMTPRIGIGLHEIGYAVPPSILLKMLNIFRSSARMFWPAYYMIYIFLFWIIVRSYRKRVALLLLGLALIVQIADCSAGWRNIGAHLKGPSAATWATSLKSPFWSCEAARYSNVRALMHVPDKRIWSDFAYYAGTHHMGTDIVYLARISNDRALLAARKSEAAIATRRFDSDSLYILDPATREKIIPHERSHYQIARIDGLDVLAPTLAGRPECPTL